MENPKVSVIIPVYNAEKTLRQCLNSVLDQNYNNYEVIVVDNNSTDKTKEIIKKFCNRNKKIKYVFEKKRGRGAARNAGIKKAKGVIIAMTDSDCIVSKNWIRELIKPIINENEKGVIGFETDLIKNYWTRNIQKAQWKLIKENLKGRYVSHLDTKNFAIKAELMKKLMFDSGLKSEEDFELYLKLKKIAKIRFNPLVKVKHNHKSSFIAVVKMNFDRGYWTKKVYEKHKCDDEIKKELMLESMSFKNFLTFPFWMILQFVTKPIGEAYFLLVSEVLWRLGIIWAIIR